MKKLSVVFLLLSLIVTQPHFVTAKNIRSRQNNRHSRRGTVRIGKYINKIHRVVARLGASPKIVIIDKDITLKADVNIPDNITVKIMENGSITLGDYDLIIHNIEAGPHPCFICNGAGKVTLGTGTTGIYPQWFGAKGDGLADDTVALQNTLLLSSDTGIPIIITEGSTFQTTERLYCYGKCTMKGTGENCVISLDETIADHWINIGISAFDIEGDWATGSFEQVHFQINNSSFAGDALFLHRVNGFTLKNCTFTLNNSCSGIKAGNNPVFTLNPYHNNIEITGCRMIASQEAEGGKGIDLSHSTTVTITDNYIFGIGDDPIALHDCKDFIIKNNSCFSVTGRIASYNSIYGVIANNYITRVQNPNGDYEAGTALIYLGTDTFEANSLYTSNNIEITNNNLICPSNSIDAGYILSCSGGREITIDNNTIKNNSPYTSGAICLTPTYYTGTWTDPDGIDADNTARSKDITISNNIIHGTETTGNGMHVQGTSAENISVKISNNLASSYDAPDNVLLEQNYEFKYPNIHQLPASFENLDSLKAKWFGSSYDDATLQAAISTIGTDHWTLHISRGTWKIDEDLTFNSNTQLKFEEGAIFDIDGARVSINGNLDAGLYQIFDVETNSKLTFGDGAVERVPVQWLGADPTGTTDATSAFNAAIATIASGVPGAIFVNGDFKINGTISVTREAISIVGGKQARLYHTPSNPNTDCISFANPTTTRYQHFNELKNIIITSSTANSHYLVCLDRQARFTMSQVYANGGSVADTGLFINFGMMNTYYQSYFYCFANNALEIDQSNTTTTQAFYACAFLQSNWGIQIDKATAITFDSCTIESNTTGGATVGQNASAGNIQFNNCHFEANPLDIQGGNNATSPYFTTMSIAETNLLGGDSRDYAMDFDNCVVSLRNLNVSRANYLFRYGANIKSIYLQPLGSSSSYGTYGAFTGPSAQAHLIYGLYPNPEFKVDDTSTYGTSYIGTTP